MPLNRAGRRRIFDPRLPRRLGAREDVQADVLALYDCPYCRTTIRVCRDKTHGQEMALHDDPVCPRFLHGDTNALVRDLIRASPRVRS